MSSMPMTPSGSGNSENRFTSRFDQPSGSKTAHPPLTIPELKEIFQTQAVIEIKKQAARAGLKKAGGKEEVLAMKEKLINMMWRTFDSPDDMLRVFQDNEVISYIEDNIARTIDYYQKEKQWDEAFSRRSPVVDSPPKKRARTEYEADAPKPNPGPSLFQELKTLQDVVTTLQGVVKSQGEIIETLGNEIEELKKTKQ